MGQRRSLRFGGVMVLGGALFAVACDSGYGATPSPAATYAGQGEHGHAGEDPPMKLVLEAVESAPDAPITLRAHVDARGGFGAPVTVSIELPPGQRHALLSPVQSHRFDVVAPGRTSREFQVARTAGQVPIKVVMDARDPNGSYGVHAEAWYPSAPVKDFVLPAKPPAVRPPAPARFAPPRAQPAGNAREVAR